MQQNAKFIRKLPIPMDIKKEFPVTEEVAKVREARVEEMRAILDGRDSRLMLIIGPCSADREDSVMDYVCRLVPLQEKVKDKILIVPRIYTNKPRTNGSGYKGMLHQPDPSKKPDMLEGIIAIRRLHTRAVQETAAGPSPRRLLCALLPLSIHYPSAQSKTAAQRGRFPAWEAPSFLFFTAQAINVTAVRAALI